MIDFSKVAETAATLLITELDTGLLFARLALDSVDETKRNRNRMNARKAYDTFLHLRHLASPDPDQVCQLEAKLLELKECLVLLGESL